MTKEQSKNVKVASFSVMALSFCAFMMFLNTQNQPMTDTARAFQRTEIYAAKMIEDKFVIKTKNPSSFGRGLASTEYGQEVLEGPVGLDPWGYPFQFLVKRNPTNPEKGTLVIWSAGADNKFETDRDMVAENHSSYNGDDFGKTYNF